MKILNTALFAISMASLPQPSYADFPGEDEVHDFIETTKITVRVNLSELSIEDDICKVNSRAVDVFGFPHNVLLTFCKTAIDSEWMLGVSARDAVAGGVTQASGANDGAPYDGVLVQFDADSGRLVSFNGVPAEVTPPKLFISWQTTNADDSDIALDFGNVGTDNATRILGDHFLIISNEDNGRAAED